MKWFERFNLEGLGILRDRLQGAGVPRDAGIVLRRYNTTVPYNHPGQLKELGLFATPLSDLARPQDWYPSGLLDVEAIGLVGSLRAMVLPYMVDFYLKADLDKAFDQLSLDLVFDSGAGFHGYRFTSGVHPAREDDLGLDTAWVVACARRGFNCLRISDSRNPEKPRPAPRLIRAR